jgi:hypothetical protein
MYQYTSKGYKFIEYDEPEPPEQRTHCRYCGSFMTKQPTRTVELVYVVAEWKDVTWEDGTPYQIQECRLATEDERMAGKACPEVTGGPEWDCPKCGHTYDVDEMYD